MSASAVGAGPQQTGSSANGAMDHTSSNGFDGADSMGYHNPHAHQQHYSSPAPMLHHQQPIPVSQHHHTQFTTLNSATASMSNSGLGPNGNGLLPLVSNNPQQQQQAINTPTSVSSFFNSFGTGTGNSPPPLSPSRLLSGLHSFLFADSNLGLDSFVDCGLSGPTELIPTSSSVNSYLLPGPLGPNSQTVAISSSGSASSSPVTLAGLNSVASTSGPSAPNNIRLPPFCTI